MNSNNLIIVNNMEKHRWEARVGDQTAVLNYTQDGDVLTLVRTKVPPTLEGKGIGSRLVRTVLENARTEGMKIIPQCPFVAAYIKRHPEYQDLVSLPDP